MGFKTKLKIILRVLVVALLIAFTAFSAVQNRWYLTTSTSALLAIAAVAELIGWLSRSQRQLSRLLLMLKHRDYTGFPAEDSSIPKDYRLAMAAIVADFRAVRLEKEQHYQFLLAVTKHIRTALICFNQHHQILLANQAVYDLLGVTLLHELKQVERISQTLHETILNFSADNAANLVIKGKLHRLSVHRTTIRLQADEITLVSLREIGSELDDNEQEAWRKLFGVLTHEIMNSTTPIASQSQAAVKILKQFDNREGKDVVVSPHDFADLIAGISSINERSNGLLKFVGAYKSLTTMPQPRLENVVVAHLFQYAKTLLDETFKNKNIEFSTRVFPKNLTILADQEMMQRLLINLLLNALYASEGIGNARVEADARLTTSDRTRLAVTDNGRGIAPEHFEKIFIPFFTTRKGGAGLGLSISREIVRLHRGQIRAISKPNEGTTMEVIL